MDSGILSGVIALVLSIFFCALYGRSQEASSNSSSDVKPSSTTSEPPPPQSTHKVCAHCGEANPPDGVYCETCGYKLP